MEQARHIIRLELIVLSIPNGQKSSSKIVRAFVSLPVDRRKDDYQGYRPIKVVMKDIELRNQLLQEAKREMVVFRSKYGLLDQLSKVFEAMDLVQ